MLLRGFGDRRGAQPADFEGIAASAFVALAHGAELRAVERYADALPGVFNAIGVTCKPAPVNATLLPAATFAGGGAVIGAAVGDATELAEAAGAVPAFGTFSAFVTGGASRSGGTSSGRDSVALE